MVKKNIINLSDSNSSESEEKEKIITRKKISKNKNCQDNDYDNVSDFETKMEYIMNALKENYMQQKKLMNDLKELSALHKKDLKIISKTNNKGNTGKFSGFNKPEPIPEPLKKLLKIDADMMSRSALTKIMYQYFTDNNMYNLKTKKEIIPNAEIKKIFGMKHDDVINFFNLQTWLKKVYDENTNLNIIE